MTTQQALKIEPAPDALGGIQLQPAPTAATAALLVPEAVVLIAQLHRQFNARRLELLRNRQLRQRDLDHGANPHFLRETAEVRAGQWRVRPAPADLSDRRVEITGPTDRKMVINALNSGANGFMADFEDSTAPTWSNLLEGQLNLRDAVARRLQFTHPETGKHYALNHQIATLMVRPRGWHLPERHLIVDGAPVAGALFDFALYLFHNHAELAARGSGPYYYLPKLESHLEARLWSEVIGAAEAALGLARGTVRVTVLIETLPAAFEMDEILYELRDHITGLNCGRWDYIFSFIKRFRSRGDAVLPDRSGITMDRHFLKSYVELLIQTCHRRGAHAMGGMAAQIPIRDDPAANQAALQRVLADKNREARAGHDGTWVAHPGLVGVARGAFDAVMRGPNQLHVTRSDVKITAADLLKVPEGAVTEAGARHNIRVGVQYLEAWLGGQGCVPLYQLMEDAATAEICRTQLWQWLHQRVRFDNGALFDATRFDQLLAEEMQRIATEVGAQRFAAGRYQRAAELFARLIHQETLEEFLTLPAYDLIA